MKKSLYFLFLILVKFSPVFSQTLTLTGKVIDQASKKPLAGVSVQTGQYHGTLTNSKGQFRLSTTVSHVSRSGLSFTYVGYKKVLLPYKGDSTFSVGMEVADNQLTEVIIYADGRTVLEKAIARIPVNYRLKPSMLNGLMRIYNTINDSDYFYRSDGIVRIYCPPYTGNNGNMKVDLIGSKQVLIRNPRSAYFTDPVQARWVGAYYAVPDPVLERPGFLRRDKLNDYDFLEKGKSMFEGRKVFVIDFRDKNRKDVEGTLYIDTATYAFAAADITRYHVNQLFFTPISVNKEHVVYQPIGGKWYLKDSHSDSRHEMDYDNNYWRDFICTSVDTLETSLFNYRDIMQQRDENIRIVKTGNPGDWQAYDSLIREGESAGTLAVFPTPSIDTTLPAPRSKHRMMKAILGYLRNDNLRYTIGIGTLPFVTTRASGLLAYQSLNSSFSVNDHGNISSSSRLNIESLLEFRVYKNLFIGTATRGNGRIGGITASDASYYITNPFELNKKHRPIRIAPSAGYGVINISRTFGKYHSDSTVINNYRFSNQDVQVSLERHAKYFTAGLNVSIELTHRKSLYLSGSWYAVLRQWDDIRFRATKGFLFFKRSETIDSDNQTGQVLPVRVTDLAFASGIRFQL